MIKDKQNILHFFIPIFCPIFVELAYTMNVTEKSDVYNFGVVARGRHQGKLLTSLSSSQSVILNEILDKCLPPLNRSVAQNISLVAAISFAC